MKNDDVSIKLRFSKSAVKNSLLILFIGMLMMFFVSNVYISLLILVIEIINVAGGIIAILYPATEKEKKNVKEQKVKEEQQVVEATFATEKTEDFKFKNQIAPVVDTVNTEVEIEEQPQQSEEKEDSFDVPDDWKEFFDSLGKDV